MGATHSLDKQVDKITRRLNNGKQNGADKFYKYFVEAKLVNVHNNILEQAKKGSPVVTLVLLNNSDVTHRLFNLLLKENTQFNTNLLRLIYNSPTISIINVDLVVKYSVKCISLHILNQDAL